MTRINSTKKPKKNYEIQKPVSRRIIKSIGNGKAHGWNMPERIIPCPHLPVLILQFSSYAQQSEALRRIAAFYESKEFRRVYIPLSDSRCDRLCKYYEGFNFPVANVEHWFRALCKHVSQSSQGDGTSWQKECNQEELWLLETLRDQGWLDHTKIAKATLTDRQASMFDEFSQWTPKLTAEVDSITARNEIQLPTPHISPRLAHTEVMTADKTESSMTPYIISQLPGVTHTTIHELQHAFWHFSPTLRDFVQELFHNPQYLNKKQRNAILFDLKQRKYAEDVYMDEFQAYAVGIFKGDRDSFGKQVDEQMKAMGKAIDKFCQAVMMKTIR